MEKAKKRQFGIIATIVLAAVIVLGLMWATATANRNAEHQDTLARVEKLGRIVWGVKADTRLFGLMDTKTGISQGFDIDIARALTVQISKQTGVPMSAEFVPVSTASKMQLLKNTNIDGSVSTMTITPEREKIIDFTNQYFDAGQSILVKKDSGINSIKDMNSSKYTVIVVVGTTAATETAKFAPKAKLLAVQDYATGMQALKSGQGQAMSTDNAILYGFATENPEYHIAGGTFTHGPYGIAFDNNQKPMIKETNAALATIKHNGIYNQLIKKWFSHVPGLDWRSLEAK
ncbi:MAG: transporter substrate-binding domain-containing protein [Leuconostoc gelidum]|jgi:putative glutamine transport system substrate-binding protein|uniref:transporter substrate-binding domain-containing protein n=1 Tax=Leuconostoc gelidum TaxID=1244 RepID=UPI001576B78C|nr:transporter substrate-binding domain-containing protein [Leuconostoc gelidum]MBZ5979310.1 transporter substrate-binding domain-containing protein [Leuconostoc gelidum subsp. gelidum]MBZ6002195.1 transporter substrate-binding domain-containing protein [Leuconostoc gelidum subsp. gelidum]MBZ6010161.1 transporter substrate-binding domain-containing protein [Leuconostoc gelidum subsp. aenigmaticum]QDJ30532.1 glutamine ABC transporter substrate-binding protein [Leuconostoc gelidum subsp. gelidum]